MRKPIDGLFDRKAGKMRRIGCRSLPRINDAILIDVDLRAGPIIDATPYNIVVYDASRHLLL